MKKQKLKKIKRQLPLYLMALPGILYLLINNYLPMTGLVVAFKEFNYRDGIWGSHGMVLTILNIYSALQLH